MSPSSSARSSSRVCCGSSGSASVAVCVACSLVGCVADSGTRGSPVPPVAASVIGEVIAEGGRTPAAASWAAAATEAFATTVMVGSPSSHAADATSTSAFA